MKYFLNIIAQTIVGKFSERRQEHGQDIPICASNIPGRDQTLESFLLGMSMEMGITTHLTVKVIIRVHGTMYFLGIAHSRS